MDNNVFVVLQSTRGDAYTLKNVSGFIFKKDKYTPYTELSVTAIDDKGIISDQTSVFNQIKLVINSYIIHTGLIDNSDCYVENGISFVKVRSRGFTSLLLNNQMVPGLHTQMSLDKLMSSYYEFPYHIQWENDTNICDYIFVKEHRSMWDSIVNLGYKLYSSYPYIRNANRITLRPHSNPMSRTFTKHEILKYGARLNTTGILSHLHMQDIEGNYGAYQLENVNADELFIVRHKQIAFDRQYLSDPTKSMQLTFSLASKAWKSKYITINGYTHLDINDCIGADGLFEPERICEVNISGTAKGIQTTYFIYEDEFSKK